MATTSKIVRKFRVNIAARRYANSSEHVRVLTGAMQIPATATPADMTFVLQAILAENLKDLHAVGRIDITLHAGN